MAGSAAAKAILLGEHAVVYGRPAVAVPLTDLRATADVRPTHPGSGIVIHAEDLGKTYRLDAEYPDRAAEALQATVRHALEQIALAPHTSDLTIAVRSRIPVACGLGSGTAVATAIVRGLACYRCRTLTPEIVSEIVYRTEVILHGTPSGVDNTVVAYERPVWFRRGAPPELLSLGAPLTLVVADTGSAANTREAVEGVRRKLEADRAGVEAIFDAIGALVDAGREALVAGGAARLGDLMTRNHEHLGALGVSTPALDALVVAARDAGALGAKLSGGGRGGCAIALTATERRDVVAAAMEGAGAARVFVTEVR